MTLNELLHECMDALQVPSWDCDGRDDHLRQIEYAMARTEIAQKDRALLRAAAQQFRKHKTVPPSMRHPDDLQEELAVANAIEARLGANHYIFHGTIYGRLKGIAKEGFVPGKSKVWAEPYVSKEFLGSAAFFTNTWRGAMGFAEVAHRSSRGRRDSLHRKPVVVRLPSAGLSLQPDPVSTAPALMVEGRVSARNADVLLGLVRGFPNWLPLDEALDPQRP